MPFCLERLGLAFRESSSPMGNGTHKVLKRIEQVSLRNGDIRHSRTNVRPMTKYKVQQAGYALTSDEEHEMRCIFLCARSKAEQAISLCKTAFG